MIILDLSSTYWLLLGTKSCLQSILKFWSRKEAFKSW